MLCHLRFWSCATSYNNIYITYICISAILNMCFDERITLLNNVFNFIYHCIFESRSVGTYFYYQLWKHHKSTNIPIHSLSISYTHICPLYSLFHLSRCMPSCSIIPVAIHHAARTAYTIHPRKQLAPQCTVAPCERDSSLELSH